MLLPFGFKNKIVDYEDYIRRKITQADALIYAQVIDGQDDGNLGYVFTKFTSRINDSRHFNLTKQNNSFLNRLLDQQLKYKEWNNINNSSKDAISRLRIATNLEGMLLMYCSALYMFKNDYATSLPVAKRMYNVEGQNKQSAIYETAANLLSFAYFNSALMLEHTQHNCEAAYENLEECVRLFPILRYNTDYLKAMARITYYRGDIRASRLYTKEFKKKEGFTWGYALNMGFYAMYEHKIDEFISWYKKLVKYPVLKEVVLFAIEFLEYELSISNNIDYSASLNVALAYLYMYINPKKAKKKIKYVRSRYNKLDNYQKLNSLIQFAEIKQPELAPSTSLYRK